MISRLVIVLAVAGFMALSPAVAEAGCVTKAARATAGSETSAKWFAMETIIQQVSWSLWPTWVATGKTPGYVIKSQHYRCTKGGPGATCRAQATICKSG